MISQFQFFIPSQRGDTLIFKDYQGDVPRFTTDKFWRKIKCSKGDARPVFVSGCLLTARAGRTKTCHEVCVHITIRRLSQCTPSVSVADDADRSLS